MLSAKKMMMFVMGVFLLTVLTLSGCRTDGGKVSELEARVTQLEQEIAVVQAERDELQTSVETLTAENAVLRQGGSTPELQISRKPKAGWEKYFPTAETTTLQGETTSKLRELLGEPPHLIRSMAVNTAFSREIWIYVPFDEDPTGLYLYFKGGTLDRSRSDEFNGLYGSGLLDNDQFWLQ